MEQIIVREAIPGDAEQLIALMNEAAGESDFLTFAKGAVRIPIEHEMMYIQKMSDSPNCLLLVAETNERLIGMLSFDAPVNDRIGQCGEFGTMVRREFWGRGVGGRLIEELIVWARGTGIVKKINLKVREDNQRAIGLYERMGFKREGYSSRAFKVKDNLYGIFMMGLEID